MMRGACRRNRSPWAYGQHLSEGYKHQQIECGPGNPSLVRCSPETILLDKLTQERDGSLRAVFDRGLAS